MKPIYTFLHLPLLFILSTIPRMAAMQSGSSSTSWCVARSDASNQQLQTALDYACWAGADCAMIQQNGLCFLPNTMQAHASYAFNSFYQRKGKVPGSCDFSGTATVAKTDPSYGSCVYPSSASSAGGMSSPTTPPPSRTITNNPFPPTMPNPTRDGGGVSGMNPGMMTPPFPMDDSIASGIVVDVILLTISFLIVSSFT